MPMTNLLGLPVFLSTESATTPGHDRPDKADAHDDDDLTALLALCGNQLFEALEFLFVVFRLGKGKTFTVGGDGKC